MAEIFNEDGSLANNNTANRVFQVANIFKQYLDCLVDTGATVAELKGITCDVIGEIVEVSDAVIVERSAAIAEKEAENVEETGN